MAILSIDFFEKVWYNKIMKGVKKMSDVKKMSKKDKKAYFAQFRGSWNGVKPVTKIVPDKRKKVKGGVVD